MAKGTYNIKTLITIVIYDLYFTNLRFQNLFGKL